VGFALDVTLMLAQVAARWGSFVAVGLALALSPIERAAADRWIDTKTGQAQPSFPVLRNPDSPSANPEDHFRVLLPDASDPNRAYDSVTGRNFARDACGDWIDTKTGQKLLSFPVVRNADSPSPNPEDHFRVVLPGAGDPKRAYDPKTGRNFAREPCPPQTATTPPPQVGMVTPPPPAPKLIPAPPGQAQQNLNQPDCATDLATGQGLKWNPDRNSWINATTGQAVGFQGLVARDGTPIPAPPMISGRTGGKHQARQDPDYPDYAHDAITGHDLKWDRDRNTWIDTKTGNAVGFQGASVSSATPVGLPTCYAMNAPAPTGSGFGFGSGGSQEDEGDRLQPERRSAPKKP